MQPFTLHTDASGKVLGCVWHHMQDERLRTLGLESRILLGAESKSCRSKLEFLVLELAVCNHFRNYLYCVKNFDVHTNFNPLAYIKTICKLNATGHRWVNELDNLSFLIKYKPGRQNDFANTLSRLLNWNSDLNYYGETCSIEDARLILDRSINQIDIGVTWILTLKHINVKIGEDQLLYNRGKKVIHFK